MGPGERPGTTNVCLHCRVSDGYEVIMFITAVVVIPMNMIADSHYSICIRAADESLVSVHRQTRCTGAPVPVPRTPYK